MPQLGLVSRKPRYWALRQPNHINHTLCGEKRASYYWEISHFSSLNTFGALLAVSKTIKKEEIL
jgi:hypothetical protein